MDMWISSVDNMFVKRGLTVNISIVTIGKLKEKYLKQGIAEFTKRLGPYAKIDIIELPDEKAPENLSESEMEQVKVKEGERILAKISDDTHVIALAIQGKQKSSEELAADLDKLATYGKSKIAFVIGGSLGLSDQVLKRSNDKLSFSKMTFPHQLMRLILLEQVYRAFRINRGEPYHK
ncbi:23S rRNA (pseudouridine1915-N3)-methyltransferase [Bacillus iocasae]|uniref:Ribosomal RNA large subunit methyltransferase H n=1 Tax=Priestia iocasae TaxID=2291674 RepID=A0ABS2QXP4_9BACI|nr:23S rRNA (pseudouridine1915-N3)-methyltransferase [Metabacillus iocasae]